MKFPAPPRPVLTNGPIVELADGDREPIGGAAGGSSSMGSEDSASGVAEVVWTEEA